MQIQPGFNTGSGTSVNKPCDYAPLNTLALCRCSQLIYIYIYVYLSMQSIVPSCTKQSSSTPVIIKLRHSAGTYQTEPCIKKYST